MKQRTLVIMSCVIGMCLAAHAGNVQAQSPSFDDDQTILAHTLKVLSKCPPASSATTPVGWRMTPLGEGGCTVFLPPDWPAANSGALFLAGPDSSETVGYGWLITTLQGTTWTAESQADFVFQELRKETPSLAVMSASNERDPYGLGITVRMLWVKFERKGLLEVGTIRVLFTGCSAILGSCQLMAQLSWAPLTQLDRYACVLAQIDATVKCPSKGGKACEDSECQRSCTLQGKSTGRCVGDTCTCWD